MTNLERAKAVHEPLKFFALDMGLITSFSSAAEDPETIASDFLCDFMHWCNWQNLNYDQVVDRAKFHFDEEIKEEEDEKKLTDSQQN